MNTKFEEKKERAKKANDLIAFIGSCGREFFNHAGDISCFILDKRGRVFFWDAHSKRRVYTHYT